MNPARKLFGKLRERAAPRSLRAQLVTRMLLLLAGLLLVIGVLQFIYMERFVYQNKASSTQRQVQSLPGDLWERVNGARRRGPIEGFIFFPSSSVAFINAEGKKTILSSYDSNTEAVPEVSADKIEKARERPRDGKPVYYIVNDSKLGEQLVVLQAIRGFQGVRGVVQVSTATKPLKLEVYRQLSIFAALAILALVAGWLTSIPVIRRTLTPLSRIVGTVERIDSGKLDSRLPERQGQEEIDSLSRSFNGMLERLEHSFRTETEAKERMRRFVADASHELRTPLTSIHGFLEVLLRGAATDTERMDKALRSMYGESERMNKLVRDLLLLARLDREPDKRFEKLDLSEVVLEMEPQLRMLAEDRRLSFELQLEAVASCDADKIKQVLLNLFHNAVQHTEPVTGYISVTVAKRSDGVELAVRDDGSGIAPEHLPHLFDRFYRIDAARARKHGGAGLGLSISQAIVSLHGGTLTVDSEPGRGSMFRVKLPAQ